MIAVEEATDRETAETRTVAMRTSLGGTGAAGRGDRGFRLLTLGAGLLVLVILAGIAWATTSAAWPAFRQEGPAFLFSTEWNPAAGRFGAGALIYGTLLVSGLALLIGVPISVGIALFTTELAGRRLRKVLGLAMDLLAAVPSVVYGIWGINALGARLDGFYGSVARTVGTWPGLSVLFGAPVGIRSFLTAGIVLGVMIIPIVTSISREVIFTVPSAQREAAVALGATRWEMIRGAVLPWSRGGITGAVMLGLGRAMGETIAVAILIGSSAQVSLRLLGPGDAMAGIIANQWGEASDVHRSALIGLGAVLFGITIVVNLTAQRIINRFDPRNR
jgi:phosphate transport system permease protein